MSPGLQFFCCKIFLVIRPTHLGIEFWFFLHCFYWWKATGKNNTRWLKQSLLAVGDVKFVSSGLKRALSLSHPLPECTWGWPGCHARGDAASPLPVACAVPSQVGWWLASWGSKKTHWTESFRIPVEKFLGLWIQAVLQRELAVELCLPLVQGGSGEARVDDANCHFLRRGMWQGVNGVSDSSYLRGISKILPVSFFTVVLKARSAFEESCTFM